MRAAVRDSLVGYHMDNDRLWLLLTPEGTFAITEYNDELTGYSPRLAEIDPKTFHYGGNAYYITGVYARERGWGVQEHEDRR